MGRNDRKVYRELYNELEDFGKEGLEFTEILGSDEVYLTSYERFVARKGEVVGNKYSERLK